MEGDDGPMIPIMPSSPITLYPSPTAVVAQGRAPGTGDMGAKPIYGT